MKKIEFKVTNVWEYTNGKTNETFVKLQLVKEQEPKEINGCLVKQNLVVYFSCASTKLGVGDTFVYDSDVMETYQRDFEREDGSKGRQLNVKMKGEL